MPASGSMSLPALMAVNWAGAADNKAMRPEVSVMALQARRVRSSTLECTRMCKIVRTTRINIDKSAAAACACAFQISGQQAMKKLLASLAAHRKSSGAIGARFQATLHILADAKVFVLHAIPHGDDSVL